MLPVPHTIARRNLLKGPETDKKFQSDAGVFCRLNMMDTNIPGSEYWL